MELGDVPLTSIGLIRVVVIIAVAWWVSKLAQGAVTRLAAYRPNFTRAALYTVNRLLHYTLLTIGFLIAVSSIGIDLTKFALFASALGVGVGFGLQTLISNFVAGLVLLFEESLKVTDRKIYSPLTACRPTRWPFSRSSAPARWRTTALMSCREPLLARNKCRRISGRDETWTA